MPKVRLTPLVDTLIDNAVGVVKTYDEAILRKLDWPATRGRRAPEGGTGGEFFAESLKIKWEEDKLLLTLPEGRDIEIPVGSRHGKIITFDGAMIAQLDADVAYFPEKRFIPIHYKDFLMFVCAESTTTGKKMFRALRIPHGYGIVVEAHVPHSVPIPIHDNSVEFKIYHRSANAVAQYNLLEPLSVDIDDVDESTTIKVIKLVEEQEENTSIKLALDFSSEKMKLETASEHNFAAYGKLIHNFEEHKEEVSYIPWPCTHKLTAFPGLEPVAQDALSADCRVGILVQDFKMTWVPSAFDKSKKMIQFNGLSGSFEGAEGKPGVEFDAETGEYSVYMLQCRPDGSFYIHPKSKHHKFIMIFAKPDSNTGEPLKETLKAFVFEHGNGARIPPHTWHSVPIPLAIDEVVFFREIIAETNANLIANIQFECNGPLCIRL